MLAGVDRFNANDWSPSSTAGKPQAQATARQLRGGEKPNRNRTAKFVVDGTGVFEMLVLIEFPLPEPQNTSDNKQEKQSACNKFPRMTQHPFYCPDRSRRRARDDRLVVKKTAQILGECRRACVAIARFFLETLHANHFEIA